MDLLQAMKERHSVRSYDEKSIEAGTVEKLRSFIKECNKKGGSLCTDPGAEHLLGGTDLQ